MSFLNRWFKKTKQEQLGKAAGAVKAAPVADQPARSAASGGKSDTAAASAAPATRFAATAYRVLVRPLITEKSATLQSAENTYTFIVARSATKAHVKQAIKELYDLTPLSVRVVQMSGRRVRFGRTPGRRADYKKAFITLPAGKTITIHAGV